MDLVISYVDSNNKDWQYNYNSQNDTSYPMYFRTHKESLKFLLRSVAKHLSFINKVFLVVQNRTEVPDYVDLDKVVIIEHQDIIPADLLPTFNSCVIEWFFHNIPNLDNLFLYLNDDTFITSDLSLEHFYKNGIILNAYELAPKNHPFTQGLIKRSTELVYGEMRYILCQHTIRCYSKTALLKFWEQYGIILQQSFTPFRNNDKNISIYALDFFQEKIGISECDKNYALTYQFISNFNVPANLSSHIRPLNQFSLLVLSDVCESPDIWLDTNLIEIFSKYFPQKCKYEKKEV